MSSHVVSGRSFTLSFQFSTNVPGSGKTAPSAFISFSSFFFLSSLFKFEEYVVTSGITWGVHEKFMKFPWVFDLRNFHLKAEFPIGQEIQGKLGNLLEDQGKSGKLEIFGERRKSQKR